MKTNQATSQHLYFLKLRCFIEKNVKSVLSSKRFLLAHSRGSELSINLHGLEDHSCTSKTVSEVFINCIPTGGINFKAMWGVVCL